ncbi:DUF305 domain-containing protein, partial [Salmonella enterica subsp. enterica serovar Montevideo]
MGLSVTVSWAGDLPAQQAAQMHQELSTSMQKMHDDMHKGMMSNDPDVAFAAGMLPHHIGAVEMAKGMMSNDPDVAFAAGMLPHHIGAVEMAK